MNLSQDNRGEKKVSWGAYHSEKRNELPTKKVSSAVLPIFYESAATASMMKHSLDIALATTEFLSKGQITFVCLDQPLYALCKQFQWTHPEIYGINKIFLIFGGLHIEKQIEQILGAYFDNSGLIDLLVLSGIMSNSDDAFLSGSFITRTRYLYQVVASNLSCMLQLSFVQSGAVDKTKCINESIKKNTQFKYWFTINNNVSDFYSFH